MNRRASACSLARRGGARYLGTSTAGVSRPPFADRLALWLDLTSPDTSIVSGAVAQIGDRSGNAYHFPQGTGTKRPAYTASDPDFGGRPSMTFDGVDDFLSRTGLPAWPQLTVAIVYHGGVSNGRRVLQYAGGSGGSVIVANTTNVLGRVTYFNGANTYKERAIVAGATRRLVTALNTATGATAVPEMYLDGVDQGATYDASASPNGPIAGSCTMGIGSASSGAASFFDDKIAEVFAYSDDLTGAEIAVFDAWLAARYSL